MRTSSRPTLPQATASSLSEQAGWWLGLYPARRHRPHQYPYLPRGVAQRCHLCHHTPHRKQWRGRWHHARCHMLCPPAPCQPAHRHQQGQRRHASHPDKRGFPLLRHHPLPRRQRPTGLSVECVGQKRVCRCLNDIEDF